MHPAFLVPAPCPANLTLPEVQHSRMAEGAVADYLAGLGVAYALKTRQSLGSDWLCFARWCAEEAHVSFPATPATVVAYLEAQAAGHSVATLRRRLATLRSEEHTSELPSLMRISYAVFCLKKKNTPHQTPQTSTSL